MLETLKLRIYQGEQFIKDIHTDGIKIIEDTIQFLESKEDSEDIVKKLKELFKED